MSISFSVLWERKSQCFTDSWCARWWGWERCTTGHVREMCSWLDMSMPPISGAVCACVSYMFDKFVIEYLIYNKREKWVRERERERERREREGSREGGRENEREKRERESPQFLFRWLKKRKLRDPKAKTAKWERILTRFVFFWEFLKTYFVWTFHFGRNIL